MAWAVLEHCCTSHFFPVLLNLSSFASDVTAVWQQLGNRLQLFWGLDNAVAFENSIEGNNGEKWQNNGDVAFQRLVFLCFFFFSLIVSFCCCSSLANCIFSKKSYFSLAQRSKKLGQLKVYFNLFQVGWKAKDKCCWYQIIKNYTMFLWQISSWLVLGLPTQPSHILLILDGKMMYFVVSLTSPDLL